MAIYETKNNETITTYAGMVVKTGYEVVQVMSDVYEDWHYAVVYDLITNTAKTIYCGKAEVDATPELMAQYKRMCENERRHTKAVCLWGEHNLLMNQAHLLSLSVSEYKKLRRTYSGRLFDGCWDLLKTKKFRNSFRESLANQLRIWLSEKENKYSFPFSPKQESYVMPYRAW